VAHEHIGVFRLPDLSRRIELDVAPYGGKGRAGVDEQKPEVIFPDLLGAAICERRDEILGFAAEVVKPIEDVEARRLDGACG